MHINCWYIIYVHDCWNIIYKQYVIIINVSNNDYYCNYDNYHKPRLFFRGVPPSLTSILAHTENGTI